MGRVVFQAGELVNILHACYMPVTVHPAGYRIPCRLLILCRHVSVESRGETYLKLANDWLAKVFGSGIGSEGDEVATVDMFLLQTALSLFESEGAFALESAGLSFLLGFPMFEWDILAFSLCGGGEG